MTVLAGNQVSTCQVLLGPVWLRNTIVGYSEYSVSFIEIHLHASCLLHCSFQLLQTSEGRTGLLCKLLPLKPKAICRPYLRRDLRKTERDTAFVLLLLKKVDNVLNTTLCSFYL